MSNASAHCTAAASRPCSIASSASKARASSACRCLPVSRWCIERSAASVTARSVAPSALLAIASPKVAWAWKKAFGAGAEAWYG